MTGNDLKKLRHDMGLTQEALARMLQVSVRTVMRREALGDKPLDWQEANAIQTLVRVWETVEEERGGRQ